MKTLILTLSVACCVLGAKAQQPTEKLLPPAKVPAWRQSFNKQLSFDNFKAPDIETKPLSDVASRQLITIEITDNMPVARLANTDKAMPIVKTDRTAYNMPVVGRKPATDKAANSDAQPWSRLCVLLTYGLQ